MSRVGEYRDSISVVSYTESVDSAGGVTYTPVNVGSYFARVENYNGSQYQYESKEQTQNNYNVELRYTSDILQGMTVIFETLKLRIDSIEIINVTDKKKMKLRCSNLT